nr:immunoglobulin light chain junction region [Macaca mulatta]
CGQGTQIPPTF